MGYILNFAAVWRSFDLLLQGLALGLGLAFAAISLGCVIGLVLAFAMTGKSQWLRAPASVYVTVLRNTPILVLILFTYFALPELGIRLGKIEILHLHVGALFGGVSHGGLSRWIGFHPTWPA